MAVWSKQAKQSPFVHHPAKPTRGNSWQPRRNCLRQTDPPAQLNSPAGPGLCQSTASLVPFASAMRQGTALAAEIHCCGFSAGAGVAGAAGEPEESPDLPELPALGVLQASLVQRSEQRDAASASDAPPAFHPFLTCQDDPQASASRPPRPAPHRRSGPPWEESPDGRNLALDAHERHKPVATE